MKNGFDLIKAFYSWVFNNQEINVKAQHIALYMFFVNQNNRNNWTEWFKCPYDLAMTGSAIRTKRDYYKILHDLHEWGLIGYLPGQAMHKSPLISLVTIKAEKSDKPVPKSEIVGYQYDTQPDTQGDTQPSTQPDTPIDTQPDTRLDTPLGTHIKHINLNTYKPINLNTCNTQSKFASEKNYEPELVEDELRMSYQEEMKKEKVPAKRKRISQEELMEKMVLPYNSQRFIETWWLYLDYKKKRGNPYTSEQGMQGALKKCGQYSEEVAIQALIEGMSNNWQGFFPEKINPNKNGKSQTPTYSAAEQFQRLRAKAHSGSN